MRFGYFLSCEDYGPAALVEQAKLAERAGFEALWISDHFHPWHDAQGQSPFVWSVIGAVAEATDLPVTTAVTCPTVRTHPAIIAQAAASMRTRYLSSCSPPRASAVCSPGTSSVELAEPDGHGLGLVGDGPLALVRALGGGGARSVLSGRLFTRHLLCGVLRQPERVRNCAGTEPELVVLVGHPGLLLPAMTWPLSATRCSCRSCTRPEKVHPFDGRARS